MRRVVARAVFTLLVACSLVDAAPVVAGATTTAINRCDGDCDGDAAVTVDEVVACTNTALGLRSLSLCRRCDANNDGAVDVGDLINSVNDVLGGCDAIPDINVCPSYVPSSCTELLPGQTLPQPLTQCYVIAQAGTYVHEYVNILENGALYFVEDPGKTIDFQAKSILVEYGGLLQAGASDCQIGQRQGTVSIGLYGDDPSKEATVPFPPPGIQCLTNPGGDQPCFPAARNPEDGEFYCTVSNSNDPCSSTTPPAQDPDNSRLEHYDRLNFDSTPFGYKAFGVSYGGTLRLFGHKGAELAGTALDPADHCAVPTPEQSTLDAAEMEAWAQLTGGSSARLTAIGQEAATGRSLLTLDRALASWGVGDEIVVGTTDWYPGHSERRTIRAVTTVQTPQGSRTQLAVDPLLYPHETNIFDAKALQTANGAEYTGPVSRTAADLRAVVGLLSRSIQVRSLGVSPQAQPTDPGFPEVANCLYNANAATDPACYFGGHVMFRQGFREVQIVGAEFKQLGQGGRIGHYPVHFHLAKSTAYTQGKAYLKNSSIWDSMTRFVVVHGTHNVTLARNVGYLSMGHGFYLEDGSEIDNLLCHNAGIEARASLKEFFAAQADPKNWPGTPPAPPDTARFIPPILDGVCPGPSYSQCICLNPPPPMPPNPPAPCGTGNQYGPTLRTGSDSYMPVMYWAMNAYNEIVGNQAVGVHGFGSCFWLLGSGVSGPSFGHHQFDGYANYNLAGAYQAPLLRFRGNGCTTATYGLPASAEVSPAALGEAVNTGYTPVANPYITNADGSLKTASELGENYLRPAVVGNFQPIQPNAGNFTNCAAGGVNPATDLEPNTQSCVTTIVDRFTTSFNWAERNYGSIWLRPWFYLLLNSAVTDQLFGGVTFVSAGSWLQVPPGYFSLVKNSLFVGTTQFGGSPWAKRSGPVFTVSATDNLARYAPCSQGGLTTCNINLEGTGFWTGGFQPKRLINIYDGPHFADDNLFLNIGSWECDPQPCLGKAPGECLGEFPCGVYGSTTQPSPSEPGVGVDPHKMIVLDAAIGWKQPNGFYYPPAFTYRAAHFFKKLPTGLPNPDPANPLNQCFAFGPGNDFSAPTELPGDCRHNVIDRTRNYIQGNMNVLNIGPGVFPPSLNQLPTTPIDFSTILIDLDASLTGASGTVSGVPGGPTTSLSRNAFFDAPAQTDECLSFGVQTSPYPFVTTLLAPLNAGADTGDTYVEPTKWPETPMVAIYRQWELAKDAETCGQICNETSPMQYGCTRGTFMVGPNVYQSPYLTQTEPPGLAEQAGAQYFIDTSSGGVRTPGPTPTGTPAPTPTPNQQIGCVTARTQQMAAAPFVANDSYVLYNLFARNDARTSYALHVGDGVNGLAALKARYVRLDPHLHITTSGPGSKFDDFRVTVKDACDPEAATGWCKDMPKPTVVDGVLTVILDQSSLASQFTAAAKADYERCMPRDLCYFDGTKCQPCLTDPSKCIRQSDFLSVDIQSMNQVDATGKMPLDVICQDWATYTSGTTSTTAGELSLSDCPAGGCVGFAFTMPATFVGDKKYADVGAKLTHCFSETAWADDKLEEKMVMGQPADPLCGAPRPAVPADFCTDPSLAQAAWE